MDGTTFISSNHFPDNENVRAYSDTLPKALNPNNKHHEKAKERLPKIVKNLIDARITIPCSKQILYLMQILCILSEKFFKSRARYINMVFVSCRATYHPFELLFEDPALIEVLKEIKEYLDRIVIDIAARSATTMSMLERAKLWCSKFIALHEALKNDGNEFYTNSDNFLKLKCDRICSSPLPNVRYDLYNKIGPTTHDPLLLECHQEILKDYISEVSKGRHQIFTDGSFFKDQNSFSCACFLASSSKSKSYKWKLESFLTIFAAELMAIYQALIFIETKKLKAVIFTDCKNCITELNNAVAQTNNTCVMQQIIDLLKRLDVLLVWIPSHYQIPGNVRADTLAKEAHINGKVLEPSEYWRWLPTPLVPKNFHENLLDQQQLNSRKELIGFGIPSVYQYRRNDLLRDLNLNLNMTLTNDELRISQWVCNGAVNFTLKFFDNVLKNNFLLNFINKRKTFAFSLCENFDINLLRFRSKLTKHNQELFKFVEEKRKQKYLVKTFERFGKIWIQKATDDAIFCALSTEHVEAVIFDEMENYPKIIFNPQTAESLFNDIIDYAARDMYSDISKLI